MKRMIPLLLLALYVLMCAAVWWRHRRRQRLAAAESAALLPAADAGPPVLVLHASQTGQAESLAWRTGKFLHLAGMPVRVCALGQVSAQDLQGARHALIIASTYGEGDPPDSAARFVRKGMGETTDLSGLRFGLLALGDRSYDQFCGFGHAVDGWLRRSGAEPLFDLVEVDAGDAGAVRHWQHQLNQILPLCVHSIRRLARILVRPTRRVKLNVWLRAPFSL